MVDVPSGYKQTKVGVLPEDWEKFHLKDILNLRLESLDMDDEKEYELITVSRRFGGVNSRGLFKGKSILVKSQFYVRENNFVISKRQIAHGACGLVPKRLDGAIVSNEYNVFQENEKLLNISFFNFYVRKPQFSRTFYSYSDGVHIEKLLFKTQSWLKQKIPFPPIKEQQKIAKILTTWDDAISKQEKLIKAKERLKKGLMQKLLSGNVRFAWFDEEWEEVKLEDVAKIIMGQSPSSKSYNEEKIGVPLIQGNADCKNRKTIPRIYTTEKTKVCKVDDIIMTVRAPVGAISKSYHNACIGRGICAIRPNEENEFLYHYLLMYEEKWEKHSQGSTFTAVNSGDIKNLKIKFPPKQEQQKIAQVLTTADKEIELLKNELESLKEQKKGLMQRLLTGEVRVSI